MVGDSQIKELPMFFPEFKRKLGRFDHPTRKMWRDGCGIRKGLGGVLLPSGSTSCPTVWQTLNRDGIAKM